MYGDLYGITQSPVTKDYFMVCRDEFCEECVVKYAGIDKHYKSCQIDRFKKRFTNWTSKNEKIDNFIKGIKQNEWIPYNQFSNINKIGKIYSARWNGVKKVVLRYLYNITIGV